MSFVVDQIRRIDAQLDRVQLATSSSADEVSSLDHTNSPQLHRTPLSHRESRIQSQRSLAYVTQLQTAIRGLSSGISDNRVLLRSSQIKFYLSALSERADINSAAEDGIPDERADYTNELRWLLISKATTQVYGHVLNSILDQAVALSDDIWYWDAILSSRVGTALYGIQHSPIRLWHWSQIIWHDVKARADDFNLQDIREDATATITKQWSQFYHLVQHVIAERNIIDVRKHALSPITRLRDEVRQKQANLRKYRVRNANALGLLLGEGLANESVHGNGLVTKLAKHMPQRLRGMIAHNVALMEAVLARINDLDVPVESFDAAIGQLTEDDPLIVSARSDQDIPVKVEDVAERLSRVLSLALPQYHSKTKQIVRVDGRPSRLIRYWFPVTVGILSSGTALRMLVNRQEEILHWVEDFGATVFDFWKNWIVEPTIKVIKTIRHDEGSEVSLMSKRSLDADRASLERMVVDFAIDNPENATGSASKLSTEQIADLRGKVREGDLTAVLTAYEKDLASPLMGTIRGNLIRALLIQIQKTKVDIEIAMGGIDALLKSQELVFGFVGLTPGILVGYSVVQWLRNFLSEKRGSKSARKQGKMLRQLRNIDRVLTNSTPTRDGELFYRDQGLLLCEVHVLRQAVEKAMPTEIYKEFCEDVEELCDVRVGVDRQKKAADRLRWAYSRYMA